MLSSRIACRRVLLPGTLLALQRCSCSVRVFHKANKYVLSLCPRRGFRTTIVRLQEQGQNKKSKDDERNPARDLALVLLTLTLASILFPYVFPEFQNQQRSEDPYFVTWKEFVTEMLAKGAVEKVMIMPTGDQVLIILARGSIFRGEEIKSLKFYKMHVGTVDWFERHLRKAEQELGIPASESLRVVYPFRAKMWSEILSYVLFGLLTVFLYKFISKRVSKSGPSLFTGMFDSFRKAKFREVDSSVRVAENLQVKFTDVLGLHEAKVEVREFVDYLKMPEKFTKLGAKLPKGALLFGPPGCGKTLLAKAVASEANVPFLATNGPEFIELIGGLGAARVRDLFKEAKRRAPCMIYIDEIDAIGRNRIGLGSMQGGGGSEQEHTLNQLLVEMDGMDSAQGIVVLASTNRADMLDKALLRRGRFDRHVDIDLPTLAERREIFEYYLKKIKLENTTKNFALPLAKMTPGFTGADIANACNEAALRAASDDKNAVTEQHLHQALDRILSGAEKRSRTVPPDEREMTAYHECGHALIGWLLEHTSALLKVTIVPRTAKALGFAQHERKDRKLYSQEQLMDHMCMVLGGRAAETLVFKQQLTGAQNDLEKATKLAYSQVKHFGMSKVLGPISFAPSAEGQVQFDKPYSKKLAALIDLEATALVTSAYKRAEQVLLRNRDKLDTLAKALLQKETLTYDEVVGLIGAPPFGEKKTTEEVDLDVPNPVEEAESKPK